MFRQKLPHRLCGIVLPLLCFSCFYLTAQNITVNQNVSPTTLIEDVLVNSNCASVSNVQAVSGDFGDGSLSYGFFERNGSDFPFENGIVLSTGKATSAVGPNDSVLSETASGWVGDPDLETALGVRNTTNATLLEFDFTPVANRISFDYLFASEEYNSPRPCDFSDGFAFLLKRVGVDEPFQNLAVVPNTNIPVKVTTVHPDFPGAFGCPAENEAFFGRLNGVVSPINFNGQTAVLTASADVIPNVTYRIKLVIADETNALFDSAIFIAGGSFSIETDLGPDRTLANGNAVCEGETLTLDASIGVVGSTFQWFLNGNMLVGETGQTLTVSTAGEYSVAVDAGGGCLSEGSVLVTFVPPPTVQNAVLLQCDVDTDGRTLFNLNQAVADLTGENQNLSVTDFFLSLADAQNNVNPIPNPENFSNTEANQQLFARIQSPFGCVSIAELTLQTTFNEIPSAQLDACSETAFATFNLSLADGQFLAGLPAGLSVRYYENPDDALLEQNSLPTFYTNNIPGMQTLFARVNDGTNCFAIGMLDIFVRPLPQIDTEENLILCVDGNTSLLLSPGVPASQFDNFEYLWSTGETTPNIRINQSGIFTVDVFNAFGCATRRTINVSGSARATITDIAVVENSDNNTIEVHVSGPGDYEFALDFIDGPYQDANLFTRVLSGFHTVFVRDKNGCGIVSQEVAVFGVPKFFTPNGDGFNDRWQVGGVPEALRAGMKIFIFDRLGKLLKDLPANSAGWDGTYRGTPMPSTDYWYSIEFADGRNVRGHFSLKR
ncbi:MAG: choice-of-anchor L domain-containing protein [Flavobacteriaceae bacterium]|nr:choice-of-anchor L domain-containing protein [Flavobacteriaceae bacterium]